MSTSFHAYINAPPRPACVSAKITIGLNIVLSPG